VRVIYGSYTGDGVDDRQVAVTLGGTLRLLVVQRSSTNMELVSVGLGGKTFSTWLAGRQATGLIKSLDADGFTVGSDAKINATGATFYYWGLVDTGDSDVVVGSYTGNGTDNRDITDGGLTGTPDFALVVRADSGDYPVWLLTGMGTAALWDYYPNLPNSIQSLIPGGAQVGTGSIVNASGGTYYYCFAASLSALSVVSYTGDGADNRSITGAGFAPHVARVQRQDANQSAWWRSADMSAGTSLLVTGGSAADRIQALEADGFQVGTNAAVNATGGTYYALCLRSLPPSTTVDMDALESGAVFGEPSVTLGGIAVDLEAKESGLAVGEPTVTLGGISVEVEAQESSLTFGEPEVALGPLTVDVDALPGTPAFGGPAVSVGPAWRPVRPGGRLVPLATRAGRIAAATARSGRIVITQEA
jgi:hypothetical protein